MQYELINGSSVGVITNPTPILRDIKDTFCVSFLLPEAGAYIALFRDESGVEYRTTIQDSTAKVPKPLLTKEQRVGLTVCKVDGEKITQSWECHPLKVGTFLSLRQTQWQIMAGLDDRELFARLAEVEREHAKTRAEFDALKADYSSHRAATAESVASFERKLAEQGEALASVKKANETLAGAYNEAIKVINDLSPRVLALEKNYDPTIIK